jgi:hypothetical protein
VCRDLRERVTARQLGMRLRLWRELRCRALQRAQALKTAAWRVARKMQAGLRDWLHLTIRARIVDDLAYSSIKQRTFVYFSSVLRHWGSQAPRMKRVREKALLRHARARVTELSTSLLEWRNVVGRCKANAQRATVLCKWRSTMRAGQAFGMWYNKALTSVDQSRACLGSAMQILCRYVKAWSMALAASKLANAYQQLALGSRVRQGRRHLASVFAMWCTFVLEHMKEVTFAVSRLRRRIAWRAFCSWRAAWVDWIADRQVLTSFMSFAGRFRRRLLERQTLARWRSVSKTAGKIRLAAAVRWCVEMLRTSRERRSEHVVLERWQTGARILGFWRIMTTRAETRAQGRAARAGSHAVRDGVERWRGWARAGRVRRRQAEVGDMNRRTNTTRRSLEGWMSVWAGQRGVRRVVDRHRVKGQVRLTARAVVGWHQHCGEGARSKRQEYVANKAVWRWQYQALDYAWERWSEQHVTLVRMKQLSTRILLRWTHGATSGAWAIWHEEYATAKGHALKAHKIVRRWEIMKYAKAFARWEEQTAVQWKLGVAASKVMTRWAHKSRALAWGKWREEARRSWVVKKAAVRLMQETLYAAWSTWEARVTEGKRMLTVGAKVCLRRQQRTMSGAWKSWQGKHSEIKRLARAADKVLLRWQYMCLAQAWRRWAKHWRVMSKMKEAGSKMLLRWQRLGLWRGFTGWSEHAATQRHMAMAADKIVRRWINLAMSPAMSRWMRRLICSMLGTWTSQVYTAQGTSALRVRSTMRLLQAVVQKWMRASQGDICGVWRGLVFQAGRKQVRHAVAIHCVKLREGAEHDLVVHAQDLLSLHHDLGKARIQAHTRGRRVGHHLWRLRNVHYKTLVRRVAIEAWCALVDTHRTLRTFAWTVLDCQRRFHFRRSCAILQCAVYWARCLRTQSQAMRAWRPKRKLRIALRAWRASRIIRLKVLRFSRRTMRRCLCEWRRFARAETTARHHAALLSARGSRLAVSSVFRTVFRVWCMHASSTRQRLQCAMRQLGVSSLSKTLSKALQCWSSVRMIEGMIKIRLCLLSRRHEVSCTSTAMNLWCLWMQQIVSLRMGLASTKVKLLRRCALAWARVTQRSVGWKRRLRHRLLSLHRRTSDAAYTSWREGARYMRWRYRVCRDLRERVTARQLGMRLRLWRELRCRALQRAQALKTAAWRVARKMQAGLRDWLHLTIRARIVDDLAYSSIKQRTFVYFSSVLRHWGSQAPRMKRVREKALLRHARARVTELSTSLLEWRNVVGRCKANAQRATVLCKWRSTMRAGQAFGMWYNKALTSVDQSRACLGSAMQILCRYVKAWSMALAASKLANAYQQLALGSRVRQGRRHLASVFAMWCTFVLEHMKEVTFAVSRLRRRIAWRAFCSWRAAWVDWIADRQVLTSFMSFAGRFRRRLLERQTLARWRSVSKTAGKIRLAAAVRWCVEMLRTSRERRSEHVVLERWQTGARILGFWRIMTTRAETRAQGRAARAGSHAVRDGVERWRGWARAGRVRRRQAEVGDMNRRTNTTRRSLEGWMSVWAGQRGVRRVVDRHRVKGQVRLTARAVVGWHQHCGEGARSKRQEYVANKAVWRWQYQALDYAWERWSEQHVTLVRMKQLSTRILLRWTHGATSGAWAIWHEEYATAKGHALKAHKIVRRWEIMKYAKAFARWEEQTAVQWKLGVAASKVMTRWAHKSRALAWGKWREEARRSWVVKKAAVRLMQETLYAAWSTWEARVTEGKRMLTVGAKVCLRRQQRTMSGAWKSWQGKHSEIKRLARAADKVLLRWQYMCLAQAWRRWAKHWRVMSKMKEAGSKMLLRWQRLGLWRGFTGWSEHAATQRHMAMAADKIVRRWINLAMSPAMSRWMRRLLCSMLGTWTSQVYTAQGTSALRVRSTMRLLQAVVQKWMRASQGDICGVWRGLVFQAGRKQVRHAVAMQYVKLREGAEHDLVVHAQDLLSLHHDLGKARIQAMQDRGLFELVSSKYELCLEETHLKSSQRIQAVQFHVCKTFIKKRNSLVCDRTFYSWCVAVDYRDAITLRLCAVKCAYVALLAWRTFCQERRRSWVRIHRFRLCRLVAMSSGVLRIFFVFAKRRCWIKRFRLRIRRVCLREPFALWQLSVRDAERTTCMQGVIRHQLDLVSLRTFFLCWSSYLVFLPKVEVLARRVLLKTRTCRQHLLVDRWKQIIRQNSSKHIFSRWIQRRCSAWRALRSLIRWRLYSRYRQALQRRSTRACLALSLPRMKLHMQAWTCYHVEQRKHPNIITQLAGKRLCKVWSCLVAWCKHCYFRRKAAATVQHRQAVRSLSTGFQTWTIASLRKVSKRAKHFYLTEWNLQLSDLLVLMIRVIHWWKQSIIKRRVLRHLLSTAALPICTSILLRCFKQWRKRKSNRKACQARVVANINITLSRAIDHIKMMTHMAKTQRIRVDRARRRAAVRSMLRIVQEWWHLRRLQRLISSRARARRVHWGKRWLMLYLHVARCCKASRRRKLSAVLRTTTLATCNVSRCTFWIGNH